MDQYAYLLLGLGLFPFWFVIYYNAPRLRRRMWGTGVYSCILALITGPFILIDYWNPPTMFGITGFYLIEDFTLSFFLTGISIGIYNFIFGISYQTLYENRKSYLLVIFFLGIITYLLSIILFHYNSVIVSIVILLLSTTAMVLMRRDLIFPAIISGIIVAFIVLLIYAILFNLIFPNYWNDYWLLADTEYGMTFFGNIPVTEIVWYFSWGAVVSISYDFASGTAKRRQKNISQKNDIIT
jgi:hypothetical protein